MTAVYMEAQEHFYELSRTHHLRDKIKNNHSQPLIAEIVQID